MLVWSHEFKFGAHGLRQHPHAKLAPAAAPNQLSDAQPRLAAFPALLEAAPHQKQQQQQPRQLPPLPLSTRGRHIVDAAGRRVKLRCVSWSGGQEAWFVPSGLWAQHRRSIAGLAASGGFNCVRLVVSLEMVLGSANGSAVVPPQAVAANDDLRGRTPLQVLDAVIAAIIKQVRCRVGGLGAARCAAQVSISMHA
jgi:hypothetical protein